MPKDRAIAERWLSARALGKDVFNFVITRKKSEFEDSNGNENENGDGDSEPVVGIMGSYHWPEVGYLIHPGMFTWSSLSLSYCLAFETFS